MRCGNGNGGGRKSVSGEGFEELRTGFEMRG